MTGFRVFPVRHHSPVAARRLVEEIRARPPRHLLIEGPADATPYIKDLTDRETVPPVALLYFVSGQAYSSFPLTEFSPEYQAMKVARELEIETRFCDLPYRLAVPGGEKPEPTADDDAPQSFDREPFDVLWEVQFELANPDLETYRKAALDVCRRLLPAAKRDRAREAYMYRTAQMLQESGVAPQDILIVCGGAHAQALLDGDVDLKLLDDLENLGEAEIYPVPYSFRRFSSVLGYGAGTAYPHFYQALWDAGGDADQAVCRMLAEICHDLQAGGFEASLADTIDAVLFVRSLANLRGKPAPGPEELVHAVDACLTRGHYGRAAEAVAQRLVGEALGRVTPGADRAPLAREFYQTVNHPQRAELLPLTDLPATRDLDLTRPRHAEVSRFLHQLALLGIPYATPEDPMAMVVAKPGRALKGAPMTLGGLSRMQARAKEAWKLRWTATLDGALADASMHGGTIAEAARAVTEGRLQSACDLLELVAIYLTVDRAGLEALVLPALLRVEEAARRSYALAPLVTAASELMTGLRYGAIFASDERTASLAAVLVRRALALWAGEPRTPDAEVRQVAQALEQLVAIAGDLPVVRAEVIAGLTRAARSHTLQPELAGICAAICLRFHLFSPVRIVADLLDRLVSSDSMSRGAEFLSGLLGAAREALLASTEATDALRDFVLRLPEERFVALLPVLRKGFRLSSSAEIRYFMAQISGGPGDAVRPPSALTRRINRRVERGAVRTLDRWLAYASEAR